LNKFQPIVRCFANSVEKISGKELNHEKARAKLTKALSREIKYEEENY